MVHHKKARKKVKQQETKETKKAMTEGSKAIEEEREDSKKKGKRHEKKVKEEGNATHGIEFWRLVAQLLPSSGAIQHPKWIQKYASNACCRQTWRRIRHRAVRRGLSHRKNEQLSRLGTIVQVRSKSSFSIPVAWFFTCIVQVRLGHCPG